jgi:predicted permease
MILLVGSGLLLKSFREIRQTDPGFDTSGILTFRISLPESSYPGALQPAAFHDELLERIRAMPGVEGAGGVTALPLAGRATGRAHALEEFPTEADELPPIFWYKWATPGYFEAMGIDMVAGRTFEPRDHQGNYGNVIVSRALAQRYWPGDGALGKRIRFAGDTAQAAWNTIIGITEGVRDRGLREDPTETVYRPLVSFREDEGWTVPSLTYVVRAENPTQLVAPIRDAIRAMDPNLPVAGVQTMASVVSNSIVRLTFTALALGIAALLALVLGAVGLYGVLSYVVTQRTQEIGVRMAVGAQAGQVLKMVVASGAKLALSGLVIGLVGAVGLTRLLQGLLFGTEPLDVGTFGATAFLLLLVGLVASYLPARRAAQVDPVKSMRME